MSEALPPAEDFLPPPLLDESKKLEDVRTSESPGRRAWRRLTRSRLVIVAMTFLALLVTACLVGPPLSGFGSDDQNLDSQLLPPSASHWLGTDSLGRDLLTRVLVGGQISLLVGILATAVASVIGVGY